MPVVRAMSLSHDSALLCRIVLGKDMRVKGLVGFSSIRRDAEERGESAQDRWYEEAQGSEASEVTGMHAELPRTMHTWHCHTSAYKFDQAGCHESQVYTTSTRHMCLLQVTSSVPLPLLQPQRMWHLSWPGGGLARASCSGSPSWPPSSSLLILQGEPDATTCVITK